MSVRNPGTPDAVVGSHPPIKRACAVHYKWVIRVPGAASCRQRMLNCLGVSCMKDFCTP